MQARARMRDLVRTRGPAWMPERGSTPVRGSMRERVWTPVRGRTQGLVKKTLARPRTLVRVQMLALTKMLARLSTPARRRPA